MRILIAGPNYALEPIGIGPCTTGLAEWLAAGGHAVEVVAGRLYYPQWRAYPLRRAGLAERTRERRQHLRCPHYVPSQPSGTKRLLHHLSFALAALPVVAWKALRRRPDVVIATAPSLLSVPFARLGAALAGGRLWPHVQDFEVDAAFATGLIHSERFGSLARKLERTLLGIADRVSRRSAQR